MLFAFVGLFCSLDAADTVKVEDDYLQGYLKAFLDINYNDFDMDVKVEDGEVLLYNMPNNDYIKSKVLASVEDFTPDNRGVKLNANDASPRKVCKTSWFPQSSLLFTPPLADPRRAEFSIGYRISDSLFSHYVTAGTIGDVFPIYRINNMRLGKLNGDFELAIEPGVWSVFDADDSSFSQINTDYRIGITANYACQKGLSFRARLYHVSAHLGDEYILKNNITTEMRKNLSYESIDLLAAYNINSDFRVYGGFGVVLASDNEFSIQPLSVEYGAEVKVLKREYAGGKLYGQPFLAMHFENSEDDHWNQNSNYALGYEWGRTNCAGRKVRLSAEYHQGYSLEGQFRREQTDYGTLKISYSY